MAAAMLLAAGCGGSEKPASTASASSSSTSSSSITTSTTTPPTRTLTILLALHDPDEGWGEAGGACAGSGGYGDITEGASVVARDETDTVVAVGRLGAGEQFLGSCYFEASLDDVPLKVEFLTIETAGRGGPMYSRDDLIADGWELELSIGD